jgi:hypothetical protein
MRNSSLNRSLSKYRKITSEKAARGELWEWGRWEPPSKCRGGNRDGAVGTVALGDYLSCPSRSESQEQPAHCFCLPLAGFSFSTSFIKSSFCSGPETEDTCILSINSWLSVPGGHWAEPGGRWDVDHRWPRVQICWMHHKKPLVGGRYCLTLNC